MNPIDLYIFTPAIAIALVQYGRTRLVQLTRHDGGVAIDIRVVVGQGAGLGRAHNHQALHTQAGQLAHDTATGSDVPWTFYHASTRTRSINTTLPTITLIRVRSGMLQHHQHHPRRTRDSTVRTGAAR